MTTVSQALRDLRSEVATRIKALTPNDRVKARAVFSEYKPIDEKPITEFTGSSRKFDIGLPMQVSRWAAGVVTQQLKFDIPIVIVYRRTYDWYLAASDDCHQIYYDILRHTSTIDGVSNRFFATDSPVVSRNPGAPWDYYTMTLEAYLNVSAT